MPRSCWNIRWRVELRRRLLNLALLEAFRMRQSGSQMETNNRRYSNMDTSRRDMLLASLLATAIEPLAAMLKGAGWTCDIERTPHGFKVAAFRGDIVGYGASESPSPPFWPQK